MQLSFQHTGIQHPARFSAAEGLYAEQVMHG